MLWVKSNAPYSSKYSTKLINVVSAASRKSANAVVMVVFRNMLFYNNIRQPENPYSRFQAAYSLCY